MKRIIIAFLFLLSGAEAYATTPIHVAVSGDGSTATTASLDTTGVNLLVFCGASSSSNPTKLDSKSNTWTALTQYGSSGRIKCWYSYNPTVGSGHTFTVTDSGSVPAVAVIGFFNAASSPFDTETGSTSTGTSASPSITPSSTSNVSVFAFVFDTAISGLAATGYTVTDELDVIGGTAWGIAMGYNIGITSPENPTISWTPSSGYAVAFSTFKLLNTVASRRSFLKPRAGSRQVR